VLWLATSFVEVLNAVGLPNPFSIHGSLRKYPGEYLTAQFAQASALSCCSGSIPAGSHDASKFLYLLHF
jgi:hypothetical protein